jgi:hypothetical protein
MIGLQGLDHGSFPRAAALLVSPLQQMIADGAVTEASQLERRHRRVASALLPPISTSRICFAPYHVPVRRTDT